MIAAFPDPVTANHDMRVRFEINRSAEQAKFYLFTASRRKIREITIPASAVVNNLMQGSNDLMIGQQELSDLSAGIYYYYIVVNTSGQSARSGIEKLIILK